MAWCFISLGLVQILFLQLSQQGHAGPSITSSAGSQGELGKAGSGFENSTHLTHCSNPLFCRVLSDHRHPLHRPCPLKGHTTAIPLHWNQASPQVRPAGSEPHLNTAAGFLMKFNDEWKWMDTGTQNQGLGRFRKIELGQQKTPWHLIKQLSLVLSIKFQLCL